MIVRIEFDEEKDLILLFGNNQHKHWHVYFKEFVEKFKKQLPAKSHSVRISEQKWPKTLKGFLNKWLTEEQMKKEYPGNYAELNFYEHQIVKDKIDHILFTNNF